MDAREMRRYMPMTVECKADEVYRWCACGQSEDRLFSDKNCSKKCQVIAYEATEDELVTFCRCKATKTPPFCDGSHGQVILRLSKS